MATRKPRPDRPRISPVTEPTELQAELMFGAGDAEVANISATMAHNTRILKRFSQFGGTVLFRGVLPARERELVILRMGWNCQSVYEFGQHTRIGLDAGLTEAEILAVTKPVEEGGWSERDRDLLVMTDELWADDCVSDATWARLSEFWSDEELVELLVTAGFYRLVSGFLNSAGVRLDPGVPGWPPGAFD